MNNKLTIIKRGQRTKRIKRKRADPVFNRQFYAIWGNDYLQASIDLHTHKVTIKRWLKDGCNNECARLYINLLYRGGIPDRDGWKLWRFVGDKIISPEGHAYTNKSLDRWTLEKKHYAQLQAFELELRNYGILEPVKLMLQRVQGNFEPKKRDASPFYLDI